MQAAQILSKDSKDGGMCISCSQISIFLYYAWVLSKSKLVTFR
jgi:hypothetical protein